MYPKDNHFQANKVWVGQNRMIGKICSYIKIKIR